VNEQSFFNYLIIGCLVLAVAVFIALFFVTAPYGRHIRRGWGATVNNKLGWVLMEATAPVGFAIFFVLGANFSVTALVFLGLWQAHYIHRAFIYPFSLRGDHLMPMGVVVMGFAFNLLNSYLNGRYIFTFSRNYTVEWLTDPRFIAGVALFVAGFIINRRADKTLRSLRKPGESGYKVPDCGLFRRVSCPNYFGEIIIWIGWAVATWSLPGLAFAAWTAANLIPRARSNHNWYREQFPDYPPERKALVPGLW
jgi:protein-S-isoprenylcysteine O-methyltransferase Ste14